MVIYVELKYTKVFKAIPYIVKVTLQMTDTTVDNSILTFEQFTNHGTDHFRDLIKELNKPRANADQLMTDWVQRICDMKDDFTAQQYYAIMFNAMNDIYHAFQIEKDKFPREFERCERLMRLMWTLSDKLRQDCGEVMLLDENISAEETQRRRSVYTHALAYFRQAMTESWVHITKIADRNLTIQWGGLLYYSIYMFEQIALANNSFQKNSFETFAQKLVKGSEAGEQ